jgi:hypothetical protein
LAYCRLHLGRHEGVRREGALVHQVLVPEAGTEQRLDLAEEEKVSFDVRNPDVHPMVSQPARPPPRRERFEAGDDQQAARDAQQLGDGLHRTNQVLQDLGARHDVEGPVGERQAAQIDRERVVELAVQAAGREIHDVDEVRVVRRHAGARGHQSSEMVHPRADVEEALEARAVEAAQDLESPQQVLEVAGRHPSRLAGRVEDPEFLTGWRVLDASLEIQDLRAPAAGEPLPCSILDAVLRERIAPTVHDGCVSWRRAAL